jgi:hypothetical protein
MQAMRNQPVPKIPRKLGMTKTVRTLGRPYDTAAGWSAQ